MIVEYRKILNEKRTNQIQAFSLDLKSRRLTCAIGPAK